MNFLFWNTGQKHVDNELCGLIKHENIDILILAEFVNEESKLLRKLNNIGIDFYRVDQIACKRIEMFSKFRPSFFIDGVETSNYTIKELKVPGIDNILMVLVHFPSKLYMSDDDQLQEAISFKQELEQEEVRRSNSRTIIVGDFNMNPFEKGMVSASAIHSVSCAISAKREKRIIQAREYSMFYNPMWNLFGDNDNKPGTYYYSAASHGVYFWNMFDQVVLRPCLIANFERKSLRIITEVPGIKLIDENKRPNVSDHLPITFSLNMSEEVNDEKSVA